MLPLWLACMTLLSAVASAQSLGDLKRLYSYDPAAPLDVKLVLKDDRAAYALHDISYSLPTGQRTDGLLAVPHVRGRKPAVVWMHSEGAAAWLGDAILLAQCGAVSLSLNAPQSAVPHSAEEYRDGMIASVVALRRAVDLLEQRDDVDPLRIAVAGHSFGAMMGAVAASVDPRFKAAVFEAGLLGMSIHLRTSPHPWAQSIRKGLGAELEQFLGVISVVDAGRYIGHAPAIPKLFQSAWFDPGVPHGDALDFYNAATGPKELRWYDTAHDIDDIGAIADRTRFLAKVLNLPAAERVLGLKTGLHRAR